MNWEYGEKAKLARRAGISRQYLNDILKKKINAPLDVAMRLEKASREMGKFIPRYDFLEATFTDNPLFG